MLGTVERRVSGGVALAVALPALGFWTATDRLDLPKLALFAGAALAVLVGGGGAADPRVALLGMAPIGAALAWPGEVAARVEGWLPWVAALAVAWGARRAEPVALERALTWLAAAVAAATWAEAITGWTLGGVGPVGATLGSPAHLGWTLAALLPFCARSTHVVAAVVGALVLTGSRTGWAMALASAPLWASLRHAPALLAVLAGWGAQGAFLAGRVADLVDPLGTAAGRLYLWRIYLSDPSWWLGLGGGPEAFVRRFPTAQAAWLGAHPEDAPFASMLEHAHADVVELGAAFGLPAILGIGWAAAGWRAPWRSSATAALLAVLVGGLTSPVAFSPATLAIAAVAFGLGLGPPGEALRLGAAPVAGALALGLALLAPRLGSEVVRTGATAARIEADPALAERRARRAAAIDPRNPRAWVELAVACRARGDEPCVDLAARAAGRDLPGAVSGPR
jgi:hypothetical protein